MPSQKCGRGECVNLSEAPLRWLAGLQTLYSSCRFSVPDLSRWLKYLWINNGKQHYTLKHAELSPQEKL